MALPILQSNLEAQGAECYRCPLQPISEFVDRTKFKWTPVRAEMNKGSTVIFVGESPGADEEEEGRPFVGPSGNELMNAFKASGHSRGAASYTNAAMCRWPENDRDRYIAKIDRANRDRRKAAKKAGESTVDLIPYPEECCRPRLMKELAKFDNIVTLGAVATKTLLGPDSHIMEVRGRPTDLVRVSEKVYVKVEEGQRVPPGKPVKLVPSLHPSFIMHGNGRWRRPFRGDIAKAMRWFYSGLKWKPPEIVYQPSPEQLEKWLFEEGPWLSQHLAWDTETGWVTDPSDALDPRRATIRCLAIGTSTKVYVIGLLSIDGLTWLYPSEELKQIVQILRKFFKDPPVILTGWNQTSFDRRMAMHVLGVTPNPKKSLDGMLLHRLCESEMPHGLAFAASTRTDSPAWKLDYHGLYAKHDRDLHRYCAIDTSNSHVMIEPMLEEIKQRGQEQLVSFDHRIMEFCVFMSELGVPINQAQVAKHELRTATEMDNWRKFTQEKSGRPTFNPGSHQQVADLLFGYYKLTVLDETDLGDPSTADVLLRDYLLDGSIPKPVKEIIKGIRRYRRAQKQRGTFVRPCKMQSEEGGRVWPDGRLRAFWNGGTVLTGRLSCDGPNIMAWPAKLSDIIEAPDGYVLVGGDLNAAEPRVAASVAHIKRFLQVFNTPGGDPHDMISEIAFGEDYSRAAGGKKEKGTPKYRLRQLGKIIGLSSLYHAQADTVYGTTTKAEDEETGELMFQDISPTKVAVFHERILKALPELEQWWEDLVSTWRLKGFVAEPIHGRRRDGLDGEDPGQFANHQAQSAVASIMGDATIELLDGPIPYEAWGPGTGIIIQKHDHLCVLCPENKAEQVKLDMERAMTRTYTELPGVDITTEVQIAKSWDRC